MLLLRRAWIIVTVNLYCGLPEREIDKMQRVQNCATRLVSGIRSDLITPVVKDLH